MIHSLRRYSTFASSTLLVLLFVVCCSIQGDARAQIQVKVGFGLVRPAKPTVEEVVEQDDLFPGGAALNTSQGLQRAMNKASEAAQKKQYEVAVTYWKQLLERMDLTLMSRTGETVETNRHAYRKYLLARREVEQAIRNLPAEGLQIYRDKVDDDARTLYEDRLHGNPEVSLEKIVNFYFLSSYGDKAAFKLANLYADRGEFTKAAGILERILSDYPDASVSQSSVLMLLSLSYAHSGDFENAEVTFAKARKATRSDKILARVDSVIKHSRTLTTHTPFTLGDWNMRLGNATRRGLMADPPFEWVSGPLTSLWEHSQGDVEQRIQGVTPLYTGSSTQQKNNNVVNQNGAGFQFQAQAFAGQIVFESRYGRPTTTLASLEQLRNNSTRWKQLEATPASQLLMADGFLFFKADRRLVCCNAKTGKIKWIGRPNQLNKAIAVTNYGRYPTQVAASSGPPLHQLKGYDEQFLFGDRIKHSMSIAGDLLLNIEGKYLGKGGDIPVPSVPNRNPFGRNIYGGQWRGETNWLAAYEIKTGKLKWYRSAMENPVEESSSKVGFLAAPVPYSNSLLVPVSNQGGVWLYSLNKKDGSLEWKISLCESPQGSVSAYSPVGLSVEGGDVYVATGAGLLFAIDARSGNIRWSIRYQRTGQMPEVSGRSHYRTAPKVQGWDDDIVIPYRHMLVVIPSDYQSIFAIDRTAGRILWESPQTPVPGDAATYYCLGVVDEKLYLASSKVVRCYNMDGGRLEWEQNFSGSVGRGFLSQKYLYLPIQNDVVKFDRMTGKELARRGVYTSVDEPLGNLYSNGDSMYVLAPGRLYSVTGMEGHLQQLAKQIQAGDPTACWDRMKLRYRMGKHDDAIADLKKMVSLMVKHQEYDTLSANQRLHEAISLMKLESTKPILTFDLLLEADQRIQQVSVQLPSSQIQHRERLLSTALRQVIAKTTVPRNHQQVIEKIIEVAPLCQKPHMLSIAQLSLTQTIASTDIPLLVTTLKVKDNSQRLLVTKVLLSKEGLKFQSAEKLVPLMTTMLKDSSEDIQFSSAEFLIHQKQRNALETLIQLLGSENINIRARSVGLLRGVSGTNQKYFAYQKPASQTVAIAAWKKWYTEEGLTAKLDFTASSAAELGRTLIAYGSSRSGRVVEYDTSGKQTWSISAPYLGACIGLPNGHRLVSNYRSHTVDEYDAGGKKIWTLSNVQRTVSSLQRLPNGNTLLASNNKVYEYSPNKSLVWSYQKSGFYARTASRLLNGNTLLTMYSNRKVIEIDPKGNTVWEMPLSFNPYSSQRLDNGNTIILNNRRNMIDEYTSSKRKVSSLKITSGATNAQRLSNGNTLVMSYRGVYEYAPSGKVVWSKSFSNVRSAHRF